MTDPTPVSPPRDWFSRLVPSLVGLLIVFAMALTFHLRRQADPLPEEQMYLEWLSDGDSRRRAEALSWYAQNHELANSALLIDACMASLTDQNSDIRGWSIELLGQVGHTHPRLAMTALCDALDDSNSSVRESATVAIDTLLRDQPEVGDTTHLRDQLRYALDDRSVPIRMTAASLLIQFNELEPVVPVIRTSLNQPYGPSASQAMAMIESRWSEFQRWDFDDLLHQAMTDHRYSSGSRIRAARLLCRLGHTDQVRPYVLQMAADDDPRFRRAAIELLQTYRLLETDVPSRGKMPPDALRRPDRSGSSDAIDLQRFDSIEIH